MSTKHYWRDQAPLWKSLVPEHPPVRRFVAMADQRMVPAIVEIDPALLARIAENRRGELIMAEFLPFFEELGVSPDQVTDIAELVPVPELDRRIK